MVTTISHVAADWKLDNIVIGDIEVLSENHHETIEDLEKKDFSFLPGQKVFVTSKCSIPRTKLKDAFKDKGLKICHNLDDADHIIIDREFFEHCTSATYSSYYPKETMEKIVKDADMILSRCKDKSIKLNFRDIVQAFTSANVMDKPALVEYRVNKQIDDTMREADLINDEGDHDYEPVRHDKRMISPKNKDLLMNIVKNFDKVVLEEKLISMTNGEIHMDKGLYESLCKYMQSDDNDNTVLAMQTMSNCNYESSALYLLLLIEQYGGKMRDSRGSHYVNFKSMIRFFDISRWKLGSLGYDDIIDILKRKNLFNQEHLSILTPLVFEEMNNGRTYKYFRIKEIEMVNPQEDDENEN